MKHDILEEVWRAREQIAVECGHDLTKLAAMLRREEAIYGERLARLPVCRKPKARGRRVSARKRVAAHD